MPLARWCAGCARETEFERFDCADHAADCLELVCVSCGFGIELAAVVATSAPRGRSADRTAA